MEALSASMGISIEELREIMVAKAKRAAVSFDESTGNDDQQNETSEVIFFDRTWGRFPDRVAPDVARIVLPQIYAIQLRECLERGIRQFVDSLDRLPEKILESSFLHLFEFRLAMWQLLSEEEHAPFLLKDVRLGNYYPDLLLDPRHIQEQFQEYGQELLTSMEQRVVSTFFGFESMAPLLSINKTSQLLDLPRELVKETLFLALKKFLGEHAEEKMRQLEKRYYAPTETEHCLSGLKTKGKKSRGGISLEIPPVK